MCATWHCSHNPARALARAQRWRRPRPQFGGVLCWRRPDCHSGSARWPGTLRREPGHGLPDGPQESCGLLRGWLHSTRDLALLSHTHPCTLWAQSQPNAMLRCGVREVFSRSPPGSGGREDPPPENKTTRARGPATVHRAVCVVFLDAECPLSLNGCP